MSQGIWTNDAQLRQLQAAFYHLKESNAQGLIVPISTPRDADEVLNLLRGLPEFEVTEAEHKAPEGVVGRLSFGAFGTYSVFLTEVVAPKYASSHTVLVAVKGVVDVSNGDGGCEYGMCWLLPRLDLRAGNAIESNSLAMPEVRSAWQFVRNHLYREVLRRYRPGRWYFIREDVDSGGLRFEY